MAGATFECLKKYFSTRTSIIILCLLIFLTNCLCAPLKERPLIGKLFPDPVLSIDALVDLCVAYDDEPSHVSRRLVARTFLRSVSS